MGKNSTEAAFLQLRDEIIRGEIPPGGLVLEQAVAGRFGISKLSAREALHRLCSEKYLKSFPRKGYLVTDISPRQIRQIQQVRYQVEALAVSQLIRHSSEADIRALGGILNGGSGRGPHETVNSRFHLGIARLSGNEYIYDSLYTYLGYTSRYALTATVADPAAYTRNHHTEMLAAMLARDEAAARDALRQDLMLEPEEV